MADEIVIGKLIIDTADLENSMTQSRRAIVELENEQKRLKKDTDNLANANDEQLKSFVANELELKKLKAEYSANQKSVLDLTKAQLGLDAALEKNIKTQEEAKINTNELKKAREAIDATTLEGAAAIAKINEKIDENNKLINENSSALEKQKNNVGNYTNSIKEAADNLNPFNGGLSGFSDRAKEAGGAGKLVQSSLSGMASGFIGVAKAGLAFIATPIGAFIAALIVVFASIKAAMNRSEEATAKITKVFAVFSGIINLLLKAISKLGEYWINSYVKILEKVGDTTEKVMKGVADALDFLGFSKASKSVTEFTNSTKSAIKASQDLASAELELEKSQRKARLTQLEYQKVAEQFRQVRDDENRTIAERIRANEQLGSTLKKQLKDELVIAELALKVANLRIEQEGRTGAALDAQADALTEIADIQERITGQESEQLANRVSLQKEAAAKQKEIEDARKERANKAFAEELKNAQLKIDLLKLEAAQSNLTTQERIDNAELIFKLENDLAERSSTGVEQQKKLIENRQALSSELLAIADEQIQKEIDDQKRVLESQKANTQLLLDEQRAGAELLAQAQIKLLDKSLLTEKEYSQELIVINTAKNEAIALANANFAEAERLRLETEAANLKALEEVQFQIKLQDILDRDASEAEIKQELRDAQYQKEIEDLNTNLAEQKISYDAYLASLSLADKKYLSDTKKNDKILSDQKKAQNLNLVKDGLNSLGQLFEGSKAVAVAQALVNTYEGISAGVALGYPAAIPAVAFAALSGFAAVRNILKTNKNSSSAGGDGGGASAPRTTSGSGSFVNTAQTETVARATDRPVEQNTIVTPPVLILEQLNEAQDNLKVKQESN